jgi:hypothetical protein
MPPVILQISSMLLLLLLPVSGSGVELGTRQQTIIPLNIPPGTPELAPSNVSQYVSSGYGAWDWGPGEDEGREFLTPSEYTGATNTARLLSYFSPADKSRGYAIGAARISGGKASFTDTSSHAYNAELVKQLSPAMQTKIAGY